MEQQNSELQMFIDYYNGEKETEIAMREMFDYTYCDEKNTNEKIKEIALAKTINHINNFYGVNPKKMHKLKVSNTISSVLLGITTGSITMALTNENFGFENGLALSAAVGAGTIVLSEFWAYRDRKILKSFDKNAQKASEMEKAIKDYHKNDKTIHFVKGKQTAQSRSR